MEKLAIVVPCYNEEEVLKIASEALRGVLDDLIHKGKIAEDSFILFVNDGSKDRTWELIEEEHQAHPVQVCGVNVMLGYYENEEATNEAIKDGWFHTGDLAKQDKDGYFFITGRKKNVIVLKNGKNIYPEELETLVGKLPYVDEGMVFGYPKDYDLIVSVKIVYNKDYVKDNFAGFTQEQLKEKIWEDIKEINGGLTNYKHMKKLIITDEPMIKTSTAKIKRHEEMSKILAEEGAIK